MKVLFTFGGLPHYYNNVLSRLNSVNNLEIAVVVPSGKGETLGKGVHQKAEGIDFKLYKLPEYRSFYGKPFFRNFNKVLRTEKPDAIVFIWPYILALLFKPLLLLKLKISGTKIIFKDIPFQLPKYNEALRFYLSNGHLTENLDTEGKKKFTDVLKYTSVQLIRKMYYGLVDAHVNYVEDAYDILPTYGVKRQSIFITYNSPDTDLLYAAREKAESTDPMLPPNTFRIIHVGRLVEWKRVDLLIKVTARLKEIYPLTELIIIGDGPQEVRLKELADELNITNAVKFIGGVYDPITLGKYLSESSIYVLAGMGGLSINEAMVFDKPVICSVCDGTEKKLVREGYNGRYYKEGSEDDLYEKIEFFFSNPDQTERMGKNSGKIIRHDVNIHTVINGYLQAFNYVSGNKYKLKINETSIKNSV